MLLMRSIGGLILSIVLYLIRYTVTDILRNVPGQNGITKKL